MAKTQSNVTTLDDEASEAGSALALSDTAAKAAAEGPKVLGTNHDSELSGVRKTVTIHPTDTDGGGDAVNVGLNGFMFQIPRGLPVSVPEEVLEIIKNAKTTTYKAGSNGQAVERTVQRFAFTAE